MAVTIRGSTDAVVEAVASALRAYGAGTADVQVYRYNPAAVRVRVIDDAFRGKNRVERHKAVWPVLDALDEETLSELTMLLLLTPEERETSLANRDFELPPFVENYSKALKAVSGNGAAGA